MPELRKDYITPTWVVIATERAKRPKDFKPETEEAGDPAKCPFCYGNEHMTPSEVLAYRKAGSKKDEQDWWVRVIPNKFPALKIEGEVDHRVSQLHNRMNGVGAHEVVIETPEHFEHMGTLEASQIAETVAAYQARYLDLAKDTRFKYIQIFKNHGRKAGASLAHPHSQIIATPMIPRKIMEEITFARTYYQQTGGTCIYCDIIELELEKKERIIYQNDAFVAIAPYASRFPFEVWILPLYHEPYFERISPQDKGLLADNMSHVLRSYNEVLGNPPYNFYIHTSPNTPHEHHSFHWHIEITPHLTNVAGFERGTGFYINPVPPEDAASALRDGKKK